MAPWLKFLIPMAFGSLGLFFWIIWSTSVWSFIAFITLFLIGSVIGVKVFKKLATPQQIKDDLQARLHND